jgi:hypothetical protein
MLRMIVIGEPVSVACDIFTDEQVCEEYAAQPNFRRDAGWMWELENSNAFTVGRRGNGERHRETFK